MKTFTGIIECLRNGEPMALPVSVEAPSVDAAHSALDATMRSTAELRTMWPRHDWSEVEALSCFILTPGDLPAIRTGGAKTNGPNLPPGLRYCERDSCFNVTANEGTDATCYQCTRVYLYNAHGALEGYVVRRNFDDMNSPRVRIMGRWREPQQVDGRWVVYLGVKARLPRDLEGRP